MPKIIANIREQLLSEAKRQIEENGYAKTTIRSVAGACGLGVGTVYNYFASKDMLIATFMLEDWQECLFQMKCISTSDPLAFLEGIHHTLTEYIERHHSLFADKDAAKTFASAFSNRHQLLRQQLATVLYPVCASHPQVEPTFLADYLAESLLTWSVAETDFSQLAPILKLIFCK